MKYCILYNPYSGNGHGKEYAEKLNDILTKDNLEYESLPDIKDYEKFLNSKENIIICGGDGTINYFANKVKDIAYNNKVYYYSTGTGNDFYNDLENKNDKPYEITKYLKHLPKVIINNKEFVMVNGVGAGLDGYCCYEGERVKHIKGKAANYKMAALKAFAYAYKPINIKVKVDNIKYEFKKVWLAPVMNGRFFGGGMKIAPNHDRLNKLKELTMVIIHDVSKLECLLKFPKIYKGTHVFVKNGVTILKGKIFEIETNVPTYLEIDGETFVNIEKYKVISN